MLEAAHRECSSHRQAVEQSPVCGCFQCLRIFPSSEIERWARSTRDRTDLTCAVCPYCFCDCILPSSAVELSDDLLKAMKAYWFARQPR